jgi:hypothetical protein
VLQTSDGRQVPGYRAAIELYVPGVYQAEALASVGGTNVTARTKFVVARPVTEITGKPMDREFLQRLADTSGGRFSRLGDWENWRKDLRVEEQHFARVQLLDLWNHPLLLSLVLALLAADWALRKLWNLP